jgi:hypothetical protein
MPSTRLALCFIVMMSYGPINSHAAEQTTASCPVLDGVYTITGIAREGFPSYFRVHAWPLTFDRLAGVPLSDDQRNAVTGFRLAGMEVFFMEEQVTIARKKIGESHANSFWCEEGVFNFAEVHAVRTEHDTGGRQRILRRFYRDDEGHLNVEVSITGTSRFLWLFDVTLAPERYAATFRALPER